MSERVRVMLSEEEVDKRIKEIGDQFSWVLCRYPAMAVKRSPAGLSGL